MKIKKILWIILFLLGATAALGEIRLESDTLNPVLNETFRIAVTFVNEEKEDYTIAGLDKNFRIVSRGSNSNFTIINGRQQSQVADIYELLPLKEGEVKLKAAGKKAASNELTLKVGKGRAAVAAGEEIEFLTNLKQDETFYFGEKIPYVEKLLFSRQLMGLNVVADSDFGELSSKNVPAVQAGGGPRTKQIRTLKGTMAAEATIYQWILEANSSGDKKMHSSSLSVETEENMRIRRNIFPEKDITLHILPLPQGKPADFQNVVGTPEINWSWNRDSVSYGDSLVLTVKISGAVNLDGLEEIAANSLPATEFNVFESVKSADETIENEGYYAEKTFEIAVIPRNTGEVTIPDMRISYFSPKSKKYEYLEIPAKKVSVTPGSGQVQPSAPTQRVAPPQGASPAVTTTPATNGPVELAASEKITVSTLPPEGESGRFSHPYGKIFLFVCIPETFVLLYLVMKRKKKAGRGSGPSLQALKSAGDDEGFYEEYCRLLRERYGYTPKAHLGERLAKSGASDALVELDREIADCRVQGKALERKKIIRRLKKEFN
ncbi:MAG: BatD family protein [Fusobacteriaceae bacterium]|nr:BatD family protein [Fusobacteriaceae bacterium]